MADMQAGDDLGPGVPFAHRHGLAVVSVCTVSHAHYARTLFQSIRSFHPHLPLVLVVADADRLGFPDIPGVRMVSPRELGAVDFPYAALKYSASDPASAPATGAALVDATSPPVAGVSLTRHVRLRSPDRFLDATWHRAVVAARQRAAAESERFWERPSLEIRISTA